MDDANHEDKDNPDKDLSPNVALKMRKGVIKTSFRLRPNNNFPYIYLFFIRVPNIASLPDPSYMQLCHH